MPDLGHFSPDVDPSELKGYLSDLVCALPSLTFLHFGIYFVLVNLGPKCGPNSRNFQFVIGEALVPRKFGPLLYKILDTPLRGTAVRCAATAEHSAGVRRDICTKLNVATMDASGCKNCDLPLNQKDLANLVICV